MLQPLRLAPGQTNPAVSRLEAGLTRTAGGLELRYELTAAPEAVRIPPPADPMRADDLWKHTCFEAFIRPAGGSAYYEINLSPSSRWAAYRFDAHRQGMTPALDIETGSTVIRPRVDGLDLTVDLTLATAPELAGAAWRVGLSAVIEAADGTLSYWALAHPPGRPDFHHADCFALKVPAPQAT